MASSSDFVRSSRSAVGVESSEQPFRRLPRLAVVSDVCVERTGGGALLLHRLLKTYPAERLRVVYNPKLAQAAEHLLLPGVGYRPVDYRLPRLIRNRFNPAWPVGMALYARTYQAAVVDALRDFGPEAILTVPHWYMWFAAAAAARRLGVPLHLIVHDDWSSLQTGNRPGKVFDGIRGACHRVMAPIYRNAQTRLVVSPGMADRYDRWFGARGTVLYPTRGDDSPTPRVRVRPARGEPPVVAFCGWIHQEGTADALRKAAREVGALGGRLDLYTGISQEQLDGRGLGPPFVRRVGFFPASEMAERIGASAHMLLLPASFLESERDDVSTLFPSKLADYTAIGLPVIVWGPEYSAAGRWACDNPRATIYCRSPDPSRLAAEIVAVARNPERAGSIAAAAIAAGDRDFGVEAARDTLFEALTRSRPSVSADPPPAVS